MTDKEKILAKIERLERQNTDIASKQARILEKITLINGSLDTLFEGINGLNVIYMRMKEHGITEDDIRDSNKSYQEGFEAAMRIKNFETGKEADAAIHNMLVMTSRKLYRGNL